MKQKREIMKKLLVVSCSLLLGILSGAQSRQEQAQQWADSVLKSLSPEQRIGDHDEVHMQSFHIHKITCRGEQWPDAG